MTEDFTTYTEVDPDGVVTVTATKVEVTAMLRGTNSYVYDDKGAGHFSGDFEHLLEGYMSSSSVNYSRWGIWGLSDLTNYEYDNSNGQEVGDFVSLLIKTGGYFVIDIGQDGYATYDRSVTLNKDTVYYLKIKRVGTTFYCYIYSDSARTTLVDTLSCSVTVRSYQYIYACCPEGGATGLAVYGYCQNLDLQEAAPSGRISRYVDLAGLGGQGQMVFNPLT